MRFSHFHIPDYYGFSTEFLQSLIASIRAFPQNSRVVPAISKSRVYRDLTPIKAVIFDVYGTLLHSAAGEIHTESSNRHNSFYVPELNINIDYETLNLHIKEYVIREHSKMNTLHHIQYPEIDCISMWLEISHDTLFPFPLHNTQEAAICAVYHELYNNPSTIMPGALSVLNNLHTKNFTLGIVSNAQFYTPLFLEACFQSSELWQNIEFPIQIWSYIQKIAKPSSELFLSLIEKCKELKIEPSEILYVGNDKKNDIAAPLKLGIQTLHFAGDSISFRTRDEENIFSNVQANAEIISLLDIIDLVSI